MASPRADCSRLLRKSLQASCDMAVIVPLVLVGGLVGNVVLVLVTLAACDDLLVALRLGHLLRVELHRLREGPAPVLARARPRV